MQVSPESKRCKPLTSGTEQPLAEALHRKRGALQLSSSATVLEGRCPSVKLVQAQVRVLKGRVDDLSAAHGRYQHSQEALRRELSSVVNRTASALSMTLDSKLVLLQQEVAGLSHSVQALDTNVQGLDQKVQAPTHKVQDLEGRMQRVFVAAAAVASTLTMVAAFSTTFSAPQLRPLAAGLGVSILWYC